jgi:hypothetical protein
LKNVGHYAIPATTGALGGLAGTAMGGMWTYDLLQLVVNYQNYHHNTCMYNRNLLEPKDLGIDDFYITTIHRTLRIPIGPQAATMTHLTSI